MRLLPVFLALFPLAFAEEPVEAERKGIVVPEGSVEEEPVEPAEGDKTGLKGIVPTGGEPSKFGKAKTKPTNLLPLEEYTPETQVPTPMFSNPVPGRKLLNRAQYADIEDLITRHRVIF